MGNGGRLHRSHQGCPRGPLGSGTTPVQRSRVPDRGSSGTVRREEGSGSRTPRAGSTGPRGRPARALGDSLRRENGQPKKRGFRIRPQKSPSSPSHSLILKRRLRSHSSVRFRNVPRVRRYRLGSSTLSFALREFRTSQVMTRGIRLQTVGDRMSPSLPLPPPLLCLSVSLSLVPIY